MEISQLHKSIQQIQAEKLSQLKSPKKIGGQRFEDVLQQTRQQQLVESGQLKISKHASQRLAKRQIVMDAGKLERLTDGVSRAKKKGIKESLVLMDNLAFVVNVKNNTVVTAMDRTETREHIFTNIDGAVVL